MTIETIPQEVISAYAIDPDSQVELLANGLVNRTIAVTGSEGKAILQRLAPMFGDGATEDMHHVSSHLATKGWQVPQIILTKAGALQVRDQQDYAWRSTTFVASDGVTPQTTAQETSTAVGELLGRWHQDMQSFDKPLQYQIPHFHDGDHIVRKMDGYLSSFEHVAAYTIGHDLLTLYGRKIQTDTTDQQLIHGDPKLDNMLFKNGKPFTLIDFDTVMRGSPWLDCGDYLRSLSGKLIDSVDEIIAHTETFTTSYGQAVESDLSTDELMRNARQATGRLATMLGMRYLNDIIDGNYFTTSGDSDERAYKHMQRAELQLRVAQLALND